MEEVSKFCLLSLLCYIVSEMALRICQGCRLSLLRAYCNAPSIAVCIDDERVKTYLSQLTGMDFDKIFKERREELTLPQYQLLTEAQLKMVFNF